MTPLCVGKKTVVEGFPVWQEKKCHIKRKALYMHREESCNVYSRADEWNRNLLNRFTTCGFWGRFCTSGHPYITSTLNIWASHQLLCRRERGKSPICCGRHIRMTLLHFCLSEIPMFTRLSLLRVRKPHARGVEIWADPLSGQEKWRANEWEGEWVTGVLSEKDK